MTASAAAAARRPARMISVDAFRGLAIIGMILVNNPGDWGTVYSPLLHAAWHGWTPTDLVFPFFLFIVGVAIVLALQHKAESGVERRKLVFKLIKRSALLFALGLFLNGFPFGLFGPQSFTDVLATWRIPGVLQRIAVCYLVVSILFITCRPRALQLWALSFLLGYWALMTLVPIPGTDAFGSSQPDIHTPAGHLSAWVDTRVFGPHVWSGSIVYDPEGILSTIPALATTLFGVFAGLLLIGSLTPTEKAVRLFVCGSLLVVAGYAWNWFFPINKAIWTSSYAVFTAGLAMCALALCYWFFDIRKHHAAAKPLVIYGVNAITVYVGSGILAGTLGLLEFGGIPLQASIYQTFFSSWLPPYPASLAYALLWVAGWFAVLLWMYRRGLMLKI